MKKLWILLALSLTGVAPAQALPVVQSPNPFAGSRFYVPNDKKKHAAIVILHGSEGGSERYIDVEAELLAAKGYAVLALCYFDCNRQSLAGRKTLKDVDPMIVLDAVRWLRRLPGNNGKVVVYGFSRGAELTMIVGSLPVRTALRPDGLIAHSPSDVFNMPWNWNWEEPMCWLCKAGPDGCTENSPLTAFRWNTACGPDDPNAMDPTLSAWRISGNSIKAGKRIEIERYKGPVLITTGDQDEVWPADQTRRIEATMKAAGRFPEVHYFRGGKHIFRGSDELKRRNLVLKFLKKVTLR